MTEYLYDAILASSGEDINISAYLTECDVNYTEGAKLVFSNDKEEIIEVDGLFVPEYEVWSFTIPANITKGLFGRYWYSVNIKGNSISFKQPIYLK